MVNVDAPEPSRPGWIKPMLAIAAFTVILTLVSTGAVLWVGRSGADYPAGAPEAAFQNFVTAAQKGDWTAADRLISSNLRAQGLTAQSVAGIVAMSDVTVSIESSYQDGDRATLDVSYEFDTGGGLTQGYFVSGSGVEMVREADGWKVDSQLGYGL